MAVPLMHQTMHSQVHEASDASHEIPTIDISGFRSSPETAQERIETQHVVDRVRSACLTTGFFCLTGHGIPRELQERVLDGAEKFFDMPLEEKLKLVHPTQKNRGYEVLGGQTLQRGAKPDLKEGFYIGKHLDGNDPRVRRHPRLMGPNIFPSGSLEDHEFKNPLETYYEAILALSLTVFKILAKGLPYGDDVFDRFVSDDPVCILRLLHYPPQTSKDPRQLGAGAHTDFGAVTLLYQTAPGLQVKSPSGSGSSGADRWIPVPPNRDAYVVNIGDMLHAWTEGLYKSSMHRVLNLGGSHRYSIPFFFDGNADCPLTPFGKSDDVGAETASEHLLRRLDETYAMAAKI
ncbi:2OG-Fe(II) oxygenase [Pyricularia oryzae 70-15]|uniref:2OG-Fe(II) oxygenase n=3 Tax=Pyricularia oryzae TaxID=318829 RepID=G4NB73_PYRO7|nr:2OG-Fe(II) oxygenase [Pyricularia oryzae 70-15]EHA48835.1 2OG-Fe(II) oxygenase [Pyricularia oryzae 70-15]ELQ38735.1 2OG-Fe(II) oxygenase [Pyricularia oryzae Y34]KAI7921029.1 2OG-Fe(II) oxygenase [Pyricularia oryzae]KAI7926610.1 2OG-Fe(II) oxygenase [Pyricularia oryzae]